MKQCTEYKDSGIEWSPCIPVDWQARPVKSKFDVQLGKMLQNDSASSLDQVVPYLKALHVNWGNVQVNDLPDMWANPNETHQYGIKNGDLLVCEGGEVGRAGIVFGVPDNCIIQNALHRVRSLDDSNIRFLMYVLYTIAGADWFSILCNKATIAHFTREKLTALRIPIPTGEEQEQIADYLDCKTAQIDDLIAKKERMIELLKEERMAIINQAVTKGLDPKIKMKDSGIEWLGKIPKHWEIKRFKYLVNPTNEVGPIFNGGIRVDLENIESWTGKYLENGNFSDDEEMKQFIPGDVLFNKLRPYLAKVFHASQNGICGGELLVLRPSGLIHSKFLYYRVISNDFIKIIDGSTYGAKMPRASWDFIGNLAITYPSLEEQANIAQNLDQKTKQIDQQIGMANKSIKLLKEYRTALISEAVTGKIDVRKDV